jgi:hypothetical protein
VKTPTKAQLQKFGEYVYRCDPEGFARWMEDQSADGDYAEVSA